MERKNFLKRFGLLSAMAALFVKRDAHALVSDNVKMPIATGNVLVGTMQIYAGEKVPNGYLLCDGQAVSRTIYAALFKAIGTTWGAGDGSTTFNVPDMREVAPVGIGQSGRTEGAHDVFTLGEFKDDQIQNHTHQYWCSGSGIATGAVRSSVSWAALDTTPQNTGRHGDVTRGKRIGVNYIIKY